MASALFQYMNYLRECFPHKTKEAIEDAIETVHQETPDDPLESQIENVVNMLADTTYVASNAPATGSSTSARVTVETSSQYFEQLLNIFADACPVYVRNVCQKNATDNFDVLMDEMLRVDYPKKQTDPEAVYTQLKEMLPNADPSYLEKQANALAFRPEDDLKNFIEDALEKEDYPTVAEYLKNMKEQEEIDRYTTHFNIKQFLKQFPDPEAHFSNPKRQLPLISGTETLHDGNIQEEELYALTFLYNYYGYLRKKAIDKVFTMCSKNLMKTCARLDTMRKAMAVPRKVIVLDKFPNNIPLLQEIAYLKHKKQIRRILKEYNINYRNAKEQARLHGLLQTCACCFDDELIPEECYFCKNGCIFCKECVKNGAENLIGEGKLDFLCFSGCGAEFSIPTLQMVLDSVVFSRMAQRKQMEEVKNANLEGLESCPFCDFSAIPLPDDKIFKCLNSDCLKESCRECRHEAHIPLRCSEIEYDEDVRMRTYIENKMTEALLRKCWKCAKVFIKESGCNKMTCTCGAAMCYVCNLAVHNYSHFKETGKCPLYTTDLNKFHAAAVIQGAQAAKADLGIDKNPSILKIDPTIGLENHFPG